MIADPRWMREHNDPGQEKTRISREIISVMLPFLILTPLIAGGLAGIDPELLKSRTDNGLAIAAAAGLAIATVVFALRIGMGIVGLGFAQLAQREQQAMWEAIEEMEQAIDAESTPEDRALGN